ncbi:ABC transporter substrate-binding protein [Verrucosispora sp. NA02020]|uniref:ABC transporter substrate-binding protein n=2 Tax=unclassified Micromonospora TaxID=2617518 RepID=UPI00159109AD|nr:ABC transporter substrate-binding protein [Verrucosispora sp. NA02020]QKW15263.1 substrate-binding domain-containing protein [Verrucosispora sp. NA02020]
MKRTLRTVIGVAMAGALAFSVAACGNDSAAEGGEEQLTIGFVPGIASDPFFRAMQVGAEAKAQELGIRLLWQGAPDEYSPQSQIPFVDSMLTQQVDGLVLVPTDPDALQPSVTKAQSANIPVVTVDTTVTDQSYLTSAITGDNREGGRQAAQTLAEQIGESGEVFLMSGSPTATTNQLREEGFTEELKKYPGITLVGKEYANSQPARATSAVNTILLKHPNLKGIFAVDGTSGSGTVAALRNAGKAEQVKLIGYDAYDNQVADLKAGIYSALVAQKPGDQAALALQNLVDTIRGQNVDSIEKDVVMTNVVMTNDNLAETEQYQYPTQ